MKRRGKLVLVVLLACTALFHVFTPLSGDILEAIGSAHISRQMGAFPQNIIEQWNLRGIGHKFAVYVLFLATATCYGGFFPSPGFETLFSAVSLVVAWTLLGLAAIAARPFLDRYSLTSFEVFYVVVVGLTAASWWVIGQPEYHVALLVLIGLGFGLSNKTWLQAISGIVLAITVFPKGVTVLSGVGGLFLLAALRSLRSDWRPLIPVAVAGGASLVVFAAGYLFAFPQEITDLHRMSLTEGALDRGAIERFRAFTVTFLFISLVHIPVAAFGLAGGALAAQRFIAQRCWVTGILFLAAVGSTCLPPLVQGKYFPYHHAVILPVYILGTVYLYRFIRDGWARRAQAVLAVFPLILMGVLSLPMLTPYQRWETNIFKLRDGRAHAYAQWGKLREALQWDTSPPVLYLSIGEPLYYLGNPSHLRYFIPHPLQRDNPTLNDSELRRQVLAEALRFDGEYVLLNNGWLDLKERRDLAPLHEWLMAHYQSVWSIDSRLTIDGKTTRFPGAEISVWRNKMTLPRMNAL